jgi:DNA repair protein RecN (Recombination protein N)
MLRSLLIKNYAIIDHLEIDWKENFTVITGETGAGKSIIIGALQLLLGGRSDSKSLRNPDEKCIIEAVFSCSKSIQQTAKEDFDLEFEDEIIIRREILSSGKSRSFINDSPALLNVLQSLTQSIVSIHQQFDHLDFFDRNYQLNIIDSYAGITDQVQSFKQSFKEYQSLIYKKKELEAQLRQGSIEKEFMEFQFNELENARLSEGELSKLEEELSIISKFEEIKSNSLQASQLILREAGIQDMVQECHHLLKSIMVNPLLISLDERLNQLQTELKDIALELENMAEATEYSEEKILEMNARINVLNSLIKKHRVSTDLELIEIRDALQNKLDNLNHSDEALTALQDKIESLHKKLLNSAEKISDQRHSKTGELIKQTGNLLIQLGMEHAKFDIQFTTSDELKENGQDSVEFLFSANKGVALRPIKDQASGGELARFNLAIKSQVAKKNEASCLIFDEIDTGVSGQVALQMGNILKSMSSHQQVICITHSPQVASRGKYHYFVFKEHKAKQTSTQIKQLNKEERLHELAKMLSGEPPTKAALKCI